MAGMRDYNIRVAQFVQRFENIRSHPVSDAFSNTDHDEIIEIYISLKKGGPPPAFVAK